MKTYQVGIVAVAVLLVVTGIGFGIAQAGGNHSDRPVLSFDDMESPVETGSLSAEYADFDPFSRSEDMHYASFDPFSRSEDMHLESPIETGAIPAAGSEESWMKEYGHD